MRLLFALLFAATSAVAQHASQPEKESAADLRAGVEVFRIEDLEAETSVWLERTAGLDYLLGMKDGDGDEKIRKISSAEARKLDLEFAARFLRCQYELPASPKDCKVTLRLVLKEDPQDVCGKDEKKAQEIVPFLKALAHRF
jgi:hypothetical protein